MAAVAGAVAVAVADGVVVSAAETDGGGAATEAAVGPASGASADLLLQATNGVAMARHSSEQTT